MFFDKLFHEVVAGVATAKINYSQEKLKKMDSGFDDENEDDVEVDEHMGLSMPAVVTKKHFEAAASNNNTCQSMPLQPQPKPMVKKAEPLDVEGTNFKMIIEEFILQHSKLKGKASFASVIGEMVARVAMSGIDPMNARQELLDAGYSEDELAIYTKGVVSLLESPVFAHMCAVSDQSVVDRVQDLVTNMTPNGMAAGQVGFQPNPAMVAAVPPSAQTPAAAQA